MFSIRPNSVIAWLLIGQMSLVGGLGWTLHAIMPHHGHAHLAICHAGHSDNGDANCCGDGENLKFGHDHQNHGCHFHESDSHSIGNCGDAGHAHSFVLKHGGESGNDTQSRAAISRSHDHRDSIDHECLVCQLLSQIEIVDGHEQFILGAAICFVWQDEPAQRQRLHSLPPLSRGPPV